MTQLSPAAEAVWVAFNDAAESVGVFEDYGDPLAAAFRALANQVVPAGSALSDQGTWQLLKRHEILAIARELKGRR